MNTQAFKFPDEQDAKDQIEAESNLDDQIEVEIEDDTPEEDRGREPMPRPIVEELEQDELEAYDDRVKERLKQMRKVWHDERRAKEAAYREQQEAIQYAKRIMDENQRLRSTLEKGGAEYAAMLQSTVASQLEAAKRAYKEAYEMGDSDKLVEAQEALQVANMRMMQARNFRVPTLQQEENAVQRQQEPIRQPVQQALDPKLTAWQDRNPWYGTDDEMTAAALGLHEKLKKSGEVEIGSEEYYAILDKTIRRRFPEQFGESESKASDAARSKPSTVVAPAVRSTSPKRIRLTASQVALAKKLGLTPQQYALELKKLEARDG